MSLMGLPPSYIVILAALALPSLVGVSLAVWGLIPRRIAGGPHCRACGYNLSGSASSRCSECRGDLNRRRAVKQGKFQRRWGRAAAGIVLAVLFAPPAMVGGWSALRGDRWDAWLPVRALLLDVEFGVLPQPLLAVRELKARSGAGMLTPNHYLAIAELAKHCAARQSGAPHGDPGWRIIAVECYAAGKLPKEYRSFVEDQILHVGGIQAVQPLCQFEESRLFVAAESRVVANAVCVQLQVAKVFVNGIERHHENADVVFVTALESQRHGFVPVSVSIHDAGLVEIALELKSEFRHALDPTQLLGARTEWLTDEVWVQPCDACITPRIDCSATVAQLRRAIISAIEFGPALPQPAPRQVEPSFNLQIRLPARLRTSIVGDFYVTPWSDQRVHLGGVSVAADFAAEQTIRLTAPLPTGRAFDETAEIEFIPCESGDPCMGNGEMAMLRSELRMQRPIRKFWPGPPAIMCTYSQDPEDKE